MFDYLFDCEWRQRSDINRLDEKADIVEASLWSAQNHSHDAQAQILFLRKEMSRMVLVLETLQRVLLDKGVCSKDEFGRMMRAVDAEDGVIDGLSSLPPDERGELQFCNGCQHFNPVHLKKCQYCGAVFKGCCEPPKPPSDPWYWTCATCNRMNSPHSKECMDCATPRATAS